MYYHDYCTHYFFWLRTTGQLSYPIELRTGKKSLRNPMPRTIAPMALHAPSKHKTFVWHLYNVGPTSSTLVQHCTNVIQMFCVCWPAHLCPGVQQTQDVESTLVYRWSTVYDAEPTLNQHWSNACVCWVMYCSYSTGTIWSGYLPPLATLALTPPAGVSTTRPQFPRQRHRPC